MTPPHHAGSLLPAASCENNAWVSPTSSFYAHSPRSVEPREDEQRAHEALPLERMHPEVGASANGARDSRALARPHWTTNSLRQAYCSGAMTMLRRKNDIHAPAVAKSTLPQSCTHGTFVASQNGDRVTEPVRAAHGSPAHS